MNNDNAMDENGIASRNICLGYVIPDYLASSLSIVNARIVITKFGWTSGAAYLSTRLNAPSEAFDPIETNTVEDRILTLTKPAKRQRF